MKKILYFGLGLSLLFMACKKDPDNIYYKEPANTGGTMELQGGIGGVSAKNSVYVDFSTNKQDSIMRVSWHIALHGGTEFGVKLNNTIGSCAKEAPAGIALNSIISQKTNDSLVTALNMGMEGGHFEIVDAIGEDISKTVIKKDKLYIYVSGDAKLPLYKVKVSESGTAYTVSYALWNSSDVKTLNVPKNADFNHIGVSFTENKKVDIQPKKSEWDIVWGRNTYKSAMAVGIPFIMPDIVFLNTKAGVQAKEILVSVGGNYDEYTAEKAKNEVLSSEIDVIGSAWRNGGGPTSQPSVKTDRFYVVKDAQGNIYKLKFVSMNEGDGGKRGYPEIKFSLLVKAK